MELQESSHSSSQKENFDHTSKKLRKIKNFHVVLHFIRNLKLFMKQIINIFLRY